MILKISMLLFNFSYCILLGSFISWCCLTQVALSLLSSWSNNYKFSSIRCILIFFSAQDSFPLLSQHLGGYDLAKNDQIIVFNMNIQEHNQIL